MDNFLYVPRSLAAAFFDSSYAWAIGVLVSLLWLGPEADDAARRALRKGLIVSASGMVVAMPVLMWLSTATMLGSSSFHRAELVDVVTGTHAGRVLIPDFVLSVLLLLLSVVPAMVGRRGGVVALLAVAAALTAFRSASGHAAGDGDFTLPEAVQFVHLGSIGLWAGGVMAAGLLALPKMQGSAGLEQMTRFGRRLSATSTVALGLVIASGIYNAWRGLDASLHPLLHTQWGGVLAVKSLLVLGALALGATNRLTLGRNAVLVPEDAARFSTSMRIESWVMVAILAVSGFLANSPPATGS